MSKKFSYDKSIKELNKIVDAIQSEEIGLDDLGKMVAKANDLIQKCRLRLREIESDIEEIAD